MIEEWFVGFHKPSLRNIEGKIDPTLWFGHCEIWGYTLDETWLFLDPQARGTRITVVHRHDDVLDQLAARHEICATILKFSNPAYFKMPIHGMMTCASICGASLGVRALLPSTLERKLRQRGAEVIHEAEGRPNR